MTRRKGELNHGQIDRAWPHQVALPAEKCRGDLFYTTHHFCEGLSVCQRTKHFYRDDRDYVVFCFADPEHADLFKARFGGEAIEPKDRPRRGGNARARAR